MNDYPNAGYHISNFKIYVPTSATVKVPLNEDFIPNTIARVSELPADELPSITSGDAGKVLTVNSGATGLEWTTPASGGGSSYTDNDVYNAIQNRFGMGMSSGTSYNYMGGTSGDNGTATLEVQGDIGQTNGIRVSQAMSDELYLDYTTQ